MRADAACLSSIFRIHLDGWILLGAGRHCVASWIPGWCSSALGSNDFTYTVQSTLIDSFACTLATALWTDLSTELSEDHEIVSQGLPVLCNMSCVPRNRLGLYTHTHTHGQRIDALRR
jgi:hypothetical protein